MNKKKIVNREMKTRYDTLVQKTTPTVDNDIYLSDGLYLLPNGDIVER